MNTEILMLGDLSEMAIMPAEPRIIQDLGDIEDYFKLRQQEINSQNFAEKCRAGLEKNRGPVPRITNSH